MAKKDTVDKKNEGKHQVLLPVPADTAKRPFVLAWVEKAAVDKLTPAGLVFSENVAGLEMKPLLESENFETTGGPDNEGADTSITF